MANYNCAIRTNYFRVRNEAEFEEMMSHVYGSEDNIDLWKETDKNGNTVYGFGCYGGISGYCENYDPEDLDEDWDQAYDMFIDKLQECVAEDDAVIIMESGWEKMRYVCGYTTVITSKVIRCIDMVKTAVNSARDMLENPEWTTKTSY